MPYLLLLFTAIVGISFIKPDTDAYIRERVVKLEGPNGICSGFIVVASSGKSYVMSAAHCLQVGAIDGKIVVITENEERYSVAVSKVDSMKDLLLLESPNATKGFQVADQVHKHEKVHTMSHGGDMPSHRTDGELLKEMDIWTGGLFPLHEMTSTAIVRQGSSGGVVLDEDEHVVGVISLLMYMNFSAFVTLADIQVFLSDK